MKKIIDENGRLFGIISVIDVAVILVLAVTAAAVYVKFNVLDLSSPATPMDTIVYQLTITNMPEGRLTSLREGDLLYDKDNDSGSAVGKIIGISSEECYIPSTLLDGSYVMGHVDGRYNVTLTIQASGTLDASRRTYLNRTNEIELGMTNNYYTKACLFSAMVTEIETREQG